MTDDIFEAKRLEPSAAPASPMAPRRGRAAGRGLTPSRRVYLRWVTAVVLGETGGFAIAAAAGVLNAQLGWDTWTLILAGALEGTSLGAAQAYAARRSGLRIPFGWWVLATAAGAALAWSIGVLPSSVANVAWANPLVIAAAALLGAVLLLSIPALQGAVLARRGLPFTSWIWMNVLAWTAGISWTFLPSPFIDESTPFGTLLAVYAAAGLLMALTVALITGLWLVRVTSSSRRIGR